MTTTQIIFNIVFLFCLNSTLLVIWFSSDAFIEYVKLLRINKIAIFEKFLQTKEYQIIKEELDFVVNYSDFLFTKQDVFLSKLLSCPYCLNLWFNIIVNCVYCYYFDFKILEGLLLAPITYILSLFTYKKLTSL